MKKIKEVLVEVKNNRVKNAEKYDKMASDLSTIGGNLSHILKYKQIPLWDNIINDTSKAESWQGIYNSAKQVNQLIDSALKENDGTSPGSFKVAKQRANRPYINIGLVAAFRQGKSTMLRAILGSNSEGDSGYSESDKKYLIPTSSDETKPCTGTKIHYINDCYKNEENVEKNNVAIVKFYSTDEVVKSMKSLVAMIGDGNVFIDEGLSLHNYREAVREKLFNGCNGNENDEITQKGQPGSPRNALWSYVFAPDDAFSNLDSKPSEIDISTSEGKKEFYKLVCFYESPDSHTEKDRSYNVLSTKEASVYKKFMINGEDPGPIRFMDTPGVGEARTSVEKTLTTALREEIDVAIAICKVDNVQIDFINQFNNYIKKDFNFVCVIDGKTVDIKDCLFYVLNVSESSQKDKIFEHKNITIKQSLAAQIDGTTSIPGIVIDDNHIVALDCKMDKQYEMEDSSEEIENHQKNVTLLKNPYPNGSSIFLYDVLTRLKETIGQIDDYYNHKAFSEHDNILYHYGLFKKLISDFKLPPIEYSQEREYKLKRIQKGIACDLSFNDKSENKLTSFISMGEKEIAREFFNSYLITNKTDDLINESQYLDFKELNEYSKIKNQFQLYFIDKLKECYDIETIQNSVNTYKNEIAKTMIKEGLDESIICNNENMWFKTFIEKFGDDYPELASLFSKINNIKLAEDAIGDYVKTDLRSCFHMECAHTQENALLFSSKNDVINLFKLWIEDIIKDIIKKINNGVQGVPSFDSIVGRTKNIYMDNFSSLRKGLDYGEKAWIQLSMFMDANSKTLFKDITAKKELVKEWKEIVNNL